MTQDEIIIAMAREACAPNQTFNSDEEWVKRFADLVAANERKKCEQEMSLMEEHCAELILIEREACAKVCEEEAEEWSGRTEPHEAIVRCAAAIRSRCSQKSKGEK